MLKSLEMLTANVSKIQESALPNITFKLNLLSENGSIFFSMGLLSKIKKKCHTCFFKAAVCSCVKMC